MGKINGGYSAFSSGPSCDPTPEPNMGKVPEMTSTIPSSKPKMGMLGDTDPYAGMSNYGSTSPPPMPSMGSDAEDAHPVKPFHGVLREQGFKYEKGEHGEAGRTNHYTRPNSGGGAESVQLHHDRGSGKVTSVTKSGDPGNSLSHSVNTSPGKLHRNIHEASYRSPANVGKAFTAGEHKAYKQSIGKGEGSGGDSALDADNPYPRTGGARALISKGWSNNNPVSVNKKIVQAHKTESAIHGNNSGYHKESNWSPEHSAATGDAVDETVTHPRGTGKPAVYAGTPGGKHPDHGSNFEKHLGSLSRASTEKRPFSIREGVVSKAKTLNTENLPHAEDALHPAHYESSPGGTVARYVRQVSSPKEKQPSPKPATGMKVTKE